MNSSFPPPAKTRRAFEIICERIRQDLADGTLKPGDKLPPERELATQFCVSRPALREALRSLEQSGVLRNAKGARGGAFVQPAASGRIVQAMQDYVHLGSITLAELTEARIAIEDVIVRLACARASKADIDELERVALATREVTGVEARYEYAVLFYAVLARATRNRVFGVFVESLATILHQFVQGPGYEILQESLIRSRLRLVEALRSRDAETAAREMRNHLNRLHRHMRRNSAAARA